MSNNFNLPFAISLRAGCTVSVMLATFLFGCSEEPPPAQPNVPEVTVIKVEPRDTPVIFEYAGKMQSSRRVEIRSRV